MTRRLSNVSAIKKDHLLSVGSANRKNSALIQLATQLLVVSCLMVLVGCDDAEPINSINPATTAQATVIEPVSMDLDLASTPLDKPLFLGLVVPQEKSAAPCPFLSDKTALAVVKTDWTLKRRETTNERCYWSKNLGFSVELTIEPLATSKPLAERVYNLESLPVLKPQSGPGDNATILYDTVWDKEQPYAISFEQNNQLIMMRVTGLTTDEERLTAAALEVANKLPAASSIDTQDDYSVTFDMCSTWRKSEIEAILGSAVQTTLGNLDCKWESTKEGVLKQIRLTIYSGQSYPWESVLEQGGLEIPHVGERGLMESKRKNSRMPAHVLLNTLYTNKLVTVSVTDTIVEYKAVALALSKNIDSRF